MPGTQQCRYRLGGELDSETCVLFVIQCNVLVGTLEGAWHLRVATLQRNSEQGQRSLPASGLQSVGGIEFQEFIQHVFSRVCRSLGLQGTSALECTLQGSRRAESLQSCQDAKALLLSLLFLGPPGLPPQPTPLRRLPLQLSLPPSPPAPPALRPPPHPWEPPHQPLNLKSLQVVAVSLQRGGAGDFSGFRSWTSLSPAPESAGTEEMPEDGEPDAAELRRRRLQKLESPVAH